MEDFERIWLTFSSLPREVVIQSQLIVGKYAADRKHFWAAYWLDNVLM